MIFPVNCLFYTMFVQTFAVSIPKIELEYKSTKPQNGSFTQISSQLISDPNLDFKFAFSQKKDNISTNISSSISSIPFNTFQTRQRNSIAFTTSTRNSATTSSTKSISTTTKSTSQLQPSTIVCAQSTASISNTIYIIIGSTVSIVLLLLSLLNIVVYLINKRKNKLLNAQKGVPIELSFSESSESNPCQSNNIDSTTQTMNSVSNPYMNCRACAKTFVNVKNLIKHEGKCYEEKEKKTAKSTKKK